MSNRNLMGALSILLLAILFISIGCGDGKRNSRANLRKVNQGPAGGGNPKDIATKAAKLKSIDDTMKAQAEAGDTNLQGIQAGTYTLSEIMGYVKFTRNQDDVSAIAIGPVSSGNLSTGSADQVGMIGGDSDQARTVEIPSSFTVQQGGAITPVNGQSNRIYSCQLAADGKIVHSLNGPGAASEINLLTRLNNGLNGTGATLFDLNGGKKGELHIRRIEGGIRMIVTVIEKKQAVKGKQNSTIIKKMAFTYTSGNRIEQTHNTAANQQQTITQQQPKLQKALDQQVPQQQQQRAQTTQPAPQEPINPDEIKVDLNKVN